jgi:hypothetical protein
VYIIGGVKTSIVLAILLASGAWAQLPNPCDRSCMTGLVDQYLAAMVKHDPSGLPLAKGVRYTENTAEIQVGEGLWVGASEAPTTFKIYAVDPASSQVAFYGVMKEWDKPLIIAMAPESHQRQDHRDRARAGAQHAPGPDAEPGHRAARAAGRRER